MDGDRLPAPSLFSNATGRSRSPVLGARSGAEGGAAQNKKERNGEREEGWLKCVMLNRSSWSTETAFLEEREWSMMSL